MRDDHESRPAEELLEHVDEPADVGLVERSIDLVEDAERAGAELKDGQEQGDRRESLLAAGEERVVERGLAGGRGDDLDAAIQHVHALLEHDVGLAAAEGLAIESLKI